MRPRTESRRSVDAGGGSPLAHVPSSTSPGSPISYVSGNASVRHRRRIRDTRRRNLAMTLFRDPHSEDDAQDRSRFFAYAMIGLGVAVLVSGMIAQ